MDRRRRRRRRRRRSDESLLVLPLLLLLRRVLLLESIRFLFGLEIVDVGGRSQWAREVCGMKRHQEWKTPPPSSGEQGSSKSPSVLPLRLKRDV